MFHYFVLLASVIFNFTSPKGYNFSNKENLFLLSVYDFNWENKEPQLNLKLKGPDLENEIHRPENKLHSFLTLFLIYIHIFERRHRILQQTSYGIAIQWKTVHP